MTEIVYRALTELKELPNNPRKITKEALETLKKSIKHNPDYFEARPIILSDRTGELVIIAGNQRYKAAKELGLDQVPTVTLKHLTEEREREIIIRDNVSNGDWDIEILEKDWKIKELDEWGVPLGDGFDKDYADFVDKFETKKTTDDCYTPPAVFDAVEKWVRKQYKIPDTTKTLRPFKPGGDYQAEDYSGDVVVIDNPPFSIASEINKWYIAHGVKFFLFCNGLTSLKISVKTQLTFLPVFAGITYENGACINTCFITNMDNENIALRCSGSLLKAIDDVQPSEAKSLAKYIRPNNLKIATDFSVVPRLGGEEIFTRDCIEPVTKACGEEIFGGAVLVSDRVAKKLDDAKKEYAEQSLEKRKSTDGYREIKLTPEELQIVKKLNAAEQKEVK